MDKWHCAINGRKYGPVSAQDLRNWLAEGRLKPTDHVWTEGMSDWAPYNTVAELNAGIPPRPGVAPVQVPAQTAPQPGNGLAVAGMILGIVSIPLICLWPIGLLCAVVGLCLSVPGKNRAKETNTGAGMAIAGIVTSCVTLGLLLIVLAIFMMGVGMAGNVLENMPRHR